MNFWSYKDRTQYYVRKKRKNKWESFQGLHQYFKQAWSKTKLCQQYQGHSDLTPVWLWIKYLIYVSVSLDKKETVKTNSPNAIENSL